MGKQSCRKLHLSQVILYFFFHPAPFWLAVKKKKTSCRSAAAQLWCTVDCYFKSQLCILWSHNLTWRDNKLISVAFFLFLLFFRVCTKFHKFTWTLTQNCYLRKKLACGWFTYTHTRAHAHAQNWSCQSCGDRAHCKRHHESRLAFIFLKTRHCFQGVKYWFLLRNFWTSMLFLTANIAW